MPTTINPTNQTIVAWITGASQGIGRALALAMAEQGITVAVSARSQDNLSTLVEDARQLPGTVVAYPLDVTDQQAVNQTVERIIRELGQIDQAILNAGTFIPMPASRFRARVIHEQMTLNVMGVCYCLEPLITAMQAKGRGLIAINASLAGYRGLPKSSAYGATKAALINMAESMYLDLRSSGIDIKIINPGFVKTPLTDKNRFSMPFLMAVDDAAKAILRGLRSNRFEIRFPFLFAGIIGLLRILPYRLYFWLIRRLY